MLPRPRHVALKPRPGPNLIDSPAPSQIPQLKVSHQPKCGRYSSRTQAAITPTDGPLQRLKRSDATPVLGRSIRRPRIIADDRPIGGVRSTQ